MHLRSGDGRKGWKLPRGHFILHLTLFTQGLVRFSSLIALQTLYVGHMPQCSPSVQQARYTLQLQVSCASLPVTCPSQSLTHRGCMNRPIQLAWSVSMRNVVPSHVPLSIHHAQAPHDASRLSTLPRFTRFMHRGGMRWHETQYAVPLHAITCCRIPRTGRARGHSEDGRCPHRYRDNGQSSACRSLIVRRV